MKLYLDDERNPKTAGWTIVRNFEEFVKCIESHGLPVEMSLDHDLGESIPTGYDCVKWMIYEKEFDLRKVSINVHSANPVGKANMEGLINSWIKHLNKYEKE
jgi:hypothetical protein